MPPSQKKKRKVTMPEKPGKARQYLVDNFHVNDGRQLCLNGHVLFMYVNSEQSITKTIHGISNRFGFQANYFDVAKLVAKGLCKLKHLSKDFEMDKFEIVCHEVFNQKPSATDPIPESTSVLLESQPIASTGNESFLSTSSAFLEMSTSSDHDPQSSSTSATLQATASAHCMSPTSASSRDLEPFSLSKTPSKQDRHQPSTIHHRGEPDTPVKAKLKKRLSFLSLSAGLQKQKHGHKMCKLREKLEGMPYTVRHLKQKVKRKDLIIQCLQQQLKKVQGGKELQKLKSQNRYLIKKQKKMKEKHESEMKKKMAEKETIITLLQHQHFLLQEECNELNDVYSTVLDKEMPSKKNKKAFSPEIRLMVFDSVMNQVPTVDVPNLIKKFSERFGITLTDIPHRNTVEMMVRELGVISELHSAEIAIAEENITLGFDATTQEGVHVNAVHLTTTTDSLVIAVDQLAGGTAEDYGQHICDSIDNLAATYADFHQADYQECRNAIINHVSNTMTDRAAVNHATVQRICQSWGKTLNELNCHLHPHDSIATSCRTALKSAETKKGHLFGNDCIAANVVLQMNKMRYKDGKGDPKGFTTFIDDHGLQRGVLPRYRGNRLHILFHICGIYIQHYDLFEKFLTTGTVSCGGLQASILADFQDPTAVAEFCVLGIFGKLLSGPWMRKFFTSAQHQIHYIEGISVVKNLLSSLSESAKAPLQILDRTTDFFGDQMEADPVWKALNVCCRRDELVRDMIVACLDAIIAVLNRQYSRYFALDITEQLKRETDSARLHNMDAEEMMGMFSAAKHHAPNATLCYLSSKMRAKKNSIISYLDAMDAEKREKVIRWAVGMARKKRHGNRTKLHEIREEMSRRAVLRRRKKEDKERKKIETLLKAVNIEDLHKTFPDLEEKPLSDLSDILSDRATGRHICHCWYDATSQDCIIYNGKIEKLKRKKNSMYIVTYWTPKENYQDAVDYEMSKFELAADVVSGDLLLS